MAGLYLPERGVLIEPEVVEIPGVTEFFVDGAVCRFRKGIVHIIAYRKFGRHHEHVVTWHMPAEGFDPSFVCAFWRWRECGPQSDLGKKMLH